MPPHVSRIEAVGARLTVVLPIAAGAFAGANLRHALALWLPGLGGTLVANVAGSVILGALLSDAAAGERFPRRTRLFVGTGLLSSFTTYSTFALDVATATPAVAIGYVAATYALGFAGVVAGRWGAGRLTGGCW